MASVLVPPSYTPPPPPKRLTRPKITLQIPDAVMMPTTPRTASVYWTPGRFPRVPGTASSHISDPNVHPYLSPFGHMYHNKASEFMFKQFEGFKDFTMNTAKSGLSAGEKTAFWFYNKLRVLSRKWFTHLFLTFSLVIYSAIGGAIFMTLESGLEKNYENKLTTLRVEFAEEITNIVKALNNKNITIKDINPTIILSNIKVPLERYEDDFTDCMKHLNDKNMTKETWSFFNSMFYAGTIYTTIVLESLMVG